MIDISDPANLISFRHIGQERHTSQTNGGIEHHQGDEEQREAEEAAWLQSVQGENGAIKGPSSSASYGYKGEGAAR